MPYSIYWRPNINLVKKKISHLNEMCICFNSEIDKITINHCEFVKNIQHN